MKSQSADDQIDNSMVIHSHGRNISETGSMVINNDNSMVVNQ